MNEKVAGDTRAEFAVIAPPEELLLVVGDVRAAGDVAVPVNGGRRRIGWDGVLPGAEGALTVIGSFDAVELPDGARAELLAGFLEDDAADPLTA